MIKLILIGAGFLLILGVASVYGMSRALGKKQEWVILSPFEATLLFKGKPLANAKVKLHYSWNTADDEEGHTEFFRTNDKGHVSIPEVKRKIFVSSMFPTGSDYTIEVMVDSKYYLVADVVKHQPELNSEFGEPLKSVSCEVTSMDMVPTKKPNDNLIVTRCRWNGSDKFKLEEL